MRIGAVKYPILLVITVLVACKQSDPPLESGIRVRTWTAPRDKQLYPTMGSAGKLWLARNLDFSTPTSWCYNDDTKLCAEYGRMYSWEEAKDVCPSGWHLPSEPEGLDIVDGYFDLQTKATVGDPIASYNAATTGSFAATLGGSRTPAGKYIDLKGDGMYWTSTSCGKDSASMVVFNEHSKRVLRDCDGVKGWAIAVRCVREIMDTGTHHKFE